MRQRGSSALGRGFRVGACEVNHIAAIAACGGAAAELLRLLRLLWLLLLGLLLLRLLLLLTCGQLLPLLQEAPNIHPLASLLLGCCSSSQLLLLHLACLWGCPGS